VTLTRVSSGLLLVDKPVGPTSHDMVAVARRALGIKRVGHSGTLDPFASGLLILLFGNATRLAEYLGDHPKEYTARARLGITTTTDDPEGEVVAERDGWKGLSETDVLRELEAFEGEIEQTPPRYSAKKIGGQPAHRRARAGEDVRMRPAKVRIHSIRLERLALPWVEFRVACSTGTYVRALARDLGEALGVGAHLVELRRTAIGPFRVEDALGPDLPPDELSQGRALLPPLAAVEHLPSAELDEVTTTRVRLGQRLSAADFPRIAPGSLVALTHEGELVAVARHRDGSIRPEKVMAGA